MRPMIIYDSALSPPIIVSEGQQPYFTEAASLVVPHFTVMLLLLGKEEEDCKNKHLRETASAAMIMILLKDGSSG
jgi:hypothetical protein